MLYASSRDALRRSLVGIATEVQGTALDEIAYEAGESDPTTPLSYQTLTSISAVFEKVKRLR